MDGESPRNRREWLHARELVMAFGWNAVVYQILNPGLSLWFSSAGDAVAGYVSCAGRWVVAGAPVCARERLGQVVEEFEAAARSAKTRGVCYFGASLRLYADCVHPPRHSVVALGAQPVWNPREWAGIVSGRKSVRAQLNRAKNKNVHIEAWPGHENENHPELRRCLDTWLANRPMPPMHFLVEPDTLGVLSDRRLFVALQGSEVVGFLIASPIPVRNGWLIEQIIRVPSAPNGCNELLVDAAMRDLDREGADYVTLGLVPLSYHIRQYNAHDPWWLKLAFRWIRAHGRRFYSFQGLEAFKAKFSPEYWEPIFAISNEPRFSMATLYAISAAFSQGQSPWRQVGGAMTRAVKQELRWLIDS